MASTATAKITFISAGAGSGKTHRLTEILHQRLTRKGTRPSGVIATTFTKKAATELRERVRAHLLAQGDFALANSIGQARIGTVNSVCGALVARFAFEAGMATEQQVLEEVQADALLAKAIDAVMDGPAMASFLAVVRRLGLIEDWRDELKALVDLVRANDIETNRLAEFASENASDLLAHFPRPTGEDLTSQLLKSIRTALPAIASAAQSGGKQNTNKYLTFLRGFERDLASGSASWSDWVKLSKMLPEVALKPLAEPIADVANRVAEHPLLHGDITRCLSQMFQLCGQALDRYANAKRELGGLDFADQEHFLLKLLDHPTVAQVLSEELDLLLVDEFQDTSPIQLALFLKLANFAKAVYWVGDVKQAIYGFRGSDADLMRTILKALPQLGGSLEVLPASWRSRSELVKLVNAIFGHAFTKSLPEAEIALTSTRNDRLPGAPIANWILGGRNAGLEASALAAGIRRLVETRYQVIDKGAIAPRDVSFGDIAVLSRSNDGVKVITAALRTQGIPSATSQAGLLATPEVTLTLACLRRLNDPSDTIATAEILSLADCLEPEEWVADRLRYLQSGADAGGWMEVATSEREAHPLIAKLGKMRHSLPLLAPREALQTVIAECGLASKVLRWAPDADVARVRLANLEALQELAAQYEDLCRAGQHAASTSGLILWLGELVAEEKDLLAEPGIDAVKVMTHHAAKGLEWPVVVLTDLATDTRDRLWSISAQSSAGLEVQAPLAGRWIRYWLWPFGAQQRVGVADAIGLTPIAQAFRDSAIEESKRLLYVSMTRARDHLVFARSSRRLTGEWLNCVEAPWLLPEEGREEIALPSGEKVSAIYWALDPIVETGAAMERAVTPLHWFQTIMDNPARLPLVFNPSGAGKSACEALEKVRIGDRIPVVNGTDMSLLGRALHACIAASFTDDAAPLSHNEVEQTLGAFGVSECVSAAAVLRQISSVHAWIRARWGKVTPFAEYPVQSVLDSGQMLNGRIDLLLQTSDGWVLIDHKSSPGRSENWDSLAKEHGSQLAAYGRAVEKASGRSVLEAWLYLPVAAGGVRLSEVR